MSSFTAPLHIAPAGDYWATVRPIGFWIGAIDSGLYIEAPAGFPTDLGSIPPILWPILPRDDPRFAAAFVIHDRLCSIDRMPRLTAAAVFLEMLRVLARKHKAPAWRVVVMFSGVLIWALIHPYGPARQPSRP